MVCISWVPKQEGEKEEEEEEGAEDDEVVEDKRLRAA